MTRRVCMFGGTFDPIHNAHMRIAVEAKNSAGLDLILFVPAGSPPHKLANGLTAWEDRFCMVEAACREHSGFVASRLEQPPRSSYSIDTVERLHAEQPSDELFFLIGSDAFDDILSWKRWEDLVRLVTFIVATRPGRTYQVPAGARIERLHSVELPVSSSDIRQRLCAGLPVPELPAEVLRYIQDHRLYGLA